MRLKNERGSLALEQVLFIGAVVIMAGGLFAFYTNMGGYFRSVSVNELARGNGVGGTASQP